MAKMTLKNALERANAFPKDREDEILDSINYPAEEESIVYYPHIKDGLETYECFCPECGNMWSEHNEESRWMMHLTCPKCGNGSKKGHAKEFGCYGMQAYGTGRQDAFLAVMEVDEENGFLLLEKVLPGFHYEPEKKLSFADMTEYADREDYSFLKGKWSLSCENKKKIVFLADKGFRSVMKDGTALSKANSFCNEFREEFRGCVLLDENSDKLLKFAENVTGTESSKENVMRNLSDYSFRLCRESSKKSRRKATRLEEMLAGYEPEQVPEAEFDNVQKLCGNAPSIVTDTFGTKKRIKVYCMSCGSMYSADIANSYIYRTDVKCPHCGASASIRSGGNDDADFYCLRFEVMPDTGYLLQRKFFVKVAVDNGGMQRTVQETGRVFYTEKQAVCFYNHSGAWTKTPNGFYRYAEFNMQSDAEIRKCIERSILKYSGLAEAWGLNAEADGRSVDCIGNSGSRSYINAWYKKPYIEKTVKAGLQEITKDFMNNIGYPVDASASSVTKLLGVTKPVFDIARKMNADMMGMKKIEKMYDLDHSITADDYAEMTNYADPDDYETLNNVYGIRPRRALDYIQSCYDEQCIEKRDAMRTWMDYLRMADDIGYDLKDKRNKFPDSLRKEHDRASFAYERIKDEISRKRFANQYKINKRYEYSSDKFIVKIPETSEEIVAEATNQRNCVASYVTRVCNGETVVAFVRKKAEPEQSYVTMEIYKNQIYQLKGFANEKVKDKDTLEFVHDFARKKNLVMNY